MTYLTLILALMQRIFFIAFRADTDISKGKTTRERESQVLQPSDSQASPDAPTAHRERLGDEVTIRPAATNNTSWAKQTSVVTTSFDGEGYTSKLDKSAADLKERARKGQRMASEIMGVCRPTQAFSAMFSTGSSHLY